MGVPTATTGWVTTRSRRRGPGKSEEEDQEWLDQVRRIDPASLKDPYIGPLQADWAGARIELGWEQLVLVMPLGDPLAQSGQRPFARVAGRAPVGALLRGGARARRAGAAGLPRRRLRPRRACARVRTCSPTSPASTLGDPRAPRAARPQRRRRPRRRPAHQRGSRAPTPDRRRAARGDRALRARAPIASTAASTPSSARSTPRALTPAATAHGALSAISERLAAGAVRGEARIPDEAPDGPERAGDRARAPAGALALAAPVVGASGS